MPIILAQSELDIEQPLNPIQEEIFLNSENEHHHVGIEDHDHNAPDTTTPLPQEEPSNQPVTADPSLPNSDTNNSAESSSQVTTNQEASVVTQPLNTSNQVSAILVLAIIVIIVIAGVIFYRRYLK